PAVQESATAQVPAAPEPSAEQGFPPTHKPPAEPQLPERCSSVRAVAAWVCGRCATSCTGPPPRPGSRTWPRTPCGPPRPPTCSTAAPTCAPCRNSSDTPHCPPPSATPTSPTNGCARHSPRRTRAPEPPRAPDRSPRLNHLLTTCAASPAGTA